MVESDTVKLLRECDAGIKMGIDSLKEVLNDVQDEKFSRCLSKCKEDHEKLENEIRKLLNQYHDEGKEPNPMAKGMSWFKTNVKLAMDESDKTIAGLMTDGCDMGVKSLSKFLNQYQNADEKAKNVAEKLIHLEKKLAEDIRCFL